MQKHLDGLSHALTQKGWTIVATRSLNDFPYDHHAWEIQRGGTKHEILFDRFGDMGEDVDLLESTGCAIYSGNHSILLRFSKPPTWLSELAPFVSKLDDLSTDEGEPKDE